VSNHTFSESRNTFVYINWLSNQEFILSTIVVTLLPEDLET
jgi:hypothetical protein